MRFADKLPVSVEIDGVEYPINWVFRTSIQFETFVQEETDDIVLIEKALKIYYGDNIPKNIPVAVDRILWFYSGGKPDRSESGGSGDPKYSFETDWDYIYTAFLEQFRVDIQDEDIHWWKFRAMFQSLNGKTRFGEIVGYRSVKISGKMTKEQRDFYKKMRKLYALPRNTKEEERMQNIKERIRNGESIESVLGIQDE